MRKRVLCALLCAVFTAAFFTGCNETPAEGSSGENSVLGIPQAAEQTDTPVVGDSGTPSKETAVLAPARSKSAEKTVSASPQAGTHDASPERESASSKPDLTEAPAQETKDANSMESPEYAQTDRSGTSSVDWEDNAVWGPKG